MEQEIIALLREKNFLGLEKFIDCFGTDIVKCIRSILNQSIEVAYHNEVSNEVFYRIWQKIDSYDERKSSLKTWSLTITRNLCLDKKRALIREQHLLPTTDFPETIHEETYFEKETFLELLTTLSPEDQLIFLKYYYYQDSPKEIATDLHMDISTIYNHLSRGRKQLIEKGGLSNGKSI